MGEESSGSGGDRGGDAGKGDAGEKLPQDEDPVSLADETVPFGAAPPRRHERTPSGAAAVPTETVDEAPPVERRAALEHLEAGATLGRYVVLERLGSGGMGVVYAAHDHELDRTVALKILRQDRGSSPEAQARLLREARAMAQLAHPHVAVVHDVGTVQGRVFVAMERVEGETLRSWITRERPPWRQVLAAFVAAGRGLAAAHAAGLVHRDFKPENVMVGRDGRVRVLDFGLARRTGGDDERSRDGAPASAEGTGTPAVATPLTAAGSVLGTPAYMAPEQHLGRTASALSDQFSFATALYEALYGEHPFQAPTPHRVRERIVAGEVSPPPAGAPVPPWLRRVLLRALAADPAARFATMEELLAALERDPGARRRRLMTAAAVVAALAAAIFLFLRQAGGPAGLCSGGEAKMDQVWGDGRRAGVQEVLLASGRPYAAAVWQAVAARLDAYATDWAAMYRQACEATHLRGEQSPELLDRRMSCLERRRLELAALVEGFTDRGGGAGAPLVDQAVEAVSSLRGLAECADAETLLARVPPPPGEARRRVAAVEERLARVKALGDLSRFEASLDLAQEVVAEARSAGYPPLEAEALALEGEALEQLGRYEDSAARFRDALLAAEAGGDDPQRVRTALRLAWVAGYHPGDPEAGRNWIQLAEATVQRLGGNRELAALVARNQAVLAAQEGRYAEAVTHGEAALEAIAATLGMDSYEAAEVSTNLGLALTYLGRYDEALRRHGQALTTYRRLFGLEHPAVADVLANVAGVHFSRQDPAAALAADQEALAIRRRVLPPDHPSTARSLNNVAQALQNLGRTAEARERQREALAMLERTLGPDHPDVAGLVNNLAFSERKAGHLEAAEAAYRRSLAGFEAALGPDHPVLAYPLTGLGGTLLEAGRGGEAVPVLERALALRPPGAVQPKDRAASAFELARALAMGGEWERAAALAREASTLYREAGEGFAEQRAQVESWLEAHGRGGRR